MMRNHTSTLETEGEGPMILRNRGRAWRLLSMALAAGLLFALAGDTSRAQIYTITGTDPLEVLELRLKPNVIVVLDTSTSMAESLGGEYVTEQVTKLIVEPGLPPYIATVDETRYYPNAYLSGDHPESKMGKAKKALRDVFARNETQVSFSFASYQQEYGPPLWMGSTGGLKSATTLTLLAGGTVPGTSDYYGSREFRFLYSTSSQLSPQLQAIYSQADPATDSVQVAKADGDTRTRGLQSWQDINPSNWGGSGTASLYWKEGIGTETCTPVAGGDPFCIEELTPVIANCRVSITSAFYLTGASLAAELETRMNGCGSNTYAVAYDPGSGTFGFTRTAGFADFVMFWLPSNSGANYHPFYNSNNPTIGPAIGAWNLTEAQEASYGFMDLTVPPDGVNEKIDRPVRTNVAYTLAHRTSATTAGGCADNDSLNEACYVEKRDTDGDGTLEDVTFFNLYTSRFWNGETIISDAVGNVCGVEAPTISSTAVRPGPDGVNDTLDDTPVLWVRQVNTCGDTTGVDVPFLYGGVADNNMDTRNNTTRSGSADGLVDRGMRFQVSGEPYSRGTLGCGGMDVRAELRPCDSGCLQYETQIKPWLEPELPMNANNEPLPGTWSSGAEVDYNESADGLYRVTSYAANASGGLRALGGTPIAKSLTAVKDRFTTTVGDAALGWWDAAGPVDCPVADGGTGLATDPFSAHDQPAAPTIVVFVSDGDDTCADSDDDLSALYAAKAAEDLFTPVDPAHAPGDPSSVRTYMIAFGEGVTPTRLNWTAWGGSGLGQGLPGMPDVPVTGARWDVGASDTAGIEAALQPLRAQCATCTDALVAKDGASLEATLQAIIDQGATSGSFSAARQSITDSVYEYVWQASGTYGTFAADDPDTRYKALAPTRFISTFSLPGFRGELRAWQAWDWDADGSTPDVAWSAGAKLNARVQAGTASCSTANQCTFAELALYVDRRVYSTTGNGVYGPGTTSWAEDPALLAGVDATLAGTVADRVTLWPPETAVSTGGFDDELGLDTLDLATLKAVYGACVGEVSATLPANCDPGTASPAQQLAEARKEARQSVLAFMAGAEAVGSRAAPKREVASPFGILYRPRSWVLADSTQATPALLGPPLPDTSGDLGAEYAVFQSGPQAAGGVASASPTRGCGLRDPEAGVDPTMSVLFLPSNDMLHAFRAGPCVSGCSETGGDELWGFVPYDLLPAVNERFVHSPQTRDNHVYMLARGVRYADVFIRKAVSMGQVCGGGDAVALNGVWRRVAFLGRGAGGKFMTALDVTHLGDYTTASASARGPIPLWNRGNPDYVEATRERSGATANHNLADAQVYAHMGETWSMPSVGLVDHTLPPYDASPRDSNRPVAHALFLGSGYGDTSGCATSGTCEGATFFTLDALTGDVLASADVGRRIELTPVTPDDPLRWDNAIVANPAGFNPRVFGLGATVHPSSNVMTRVYVGDLHGRLWKFLTRSPEVNVLLANLSTTVDPIDPAAAPAQPVATAAGLLGMPPYQGNPDLVEPHVYATSGYDRRAMGPFKIFGFRDTGGDTDTQLGTPVNNPDQNDAAQPKYCPPPCNVQTFDGNAGSELIIARWFDEGTAQGTCGVNPIPGNVFRGTIAPATTFELCSPASPTCTLALGRVFFGGTRLNLPGTEYAPPTPIKCGGTGTYPCRSSFDSIVYALGAASGMAAYDLNSGLGDDAYRIYRDQRISALSMAADPAQGGGSSLLIDEGQLSGMPPAAPPAAGVPPNSVQSGSASVVLSRDPNFPPPSIRMGSAVCQ